MIVIDTETREGRELWESYDVGCHRHRFLVAHARALGIDLGTVEDVVESYERTDGRERRLCATMVTPDLLIRVF